MPSTSPVQELETMPDNNPSRGYVWRSGIGKPMDEGQTLQKRLAEEPGVITNVNREDVTRDRGCMKACIDELIVKGIAGQKLIEKFCRRLTSAIPGGCNISGKVKKRENIRMKIDGTRLPKKTAPQVNDVSRATVEFSTSKDGLFAAESWVREQPEYKNLKQRCGDEVILCKNWWSEKALRANQGEGNYKDVKFFLGFNLTAEGIPSQKLWVAELQLNLTTAQHWKHFGHGIYEITRMSNPQLSSPVTIQPRDVYKIANKLRKCWRVLHQADISSRQDQVHEIYDVTPKKEGIAVNRTKVGMDTQAIVDFGSMLHQRFPFLTKLDRDRREIPASVDITEEDLKILTRVSVVLYNYSFYATNKAKVGGKGQLQWDGGNK